MNTKILKSPKDSKGNYLELILDKNKVIKNDPGQDTPAIVVLRDRKGFEIDCGTWFAASDTGELSHHGTQLEPEHCKWLNNQADEVNNFLYEN